MRVTTTLISIFLLSFSLLTAQAPKWAEMMQEPDARFDETVAEFEAYWEGREITKGSGWKPFKRWQWYMQDRLTPQGTQAGPLRTRAEMEEYYASHPLPADKRSSLTGSWQQLGPVTLPANGTGQPNGLGRVTAIAFHPTDPNTIFAGAPAGGFWKSTDYGVNWNYLSTGLTRLGISSIVVHPSTPNTIYVGTGDRDGGDSPGYGVWRSTDGGLTWNSWNNGMGNRTVNEVIMDPGNPNIMIAATNSRIYRTVDGGANWTQVFTGHNCKDIAFHPTNSNIVYATRTNFYRSTNNGVSWTQVTNGVPTGIARMAIGVSANTPNNVYLFAGTNAGFRGLYRSTDSGQNFTQRSNSPNLFGYDVTGGTGSQAWYDCVMIADPTDGNHLYTGAINIWESFDGGSNWSISSHWVGSGGNPAVHADQHVMEYSPLTGDLWAGHDGGIHVTNNAGVAWNEVSSGLAIAQVYKIGQAQTSKDLVINGYQDNGTAYYRNGNWYTEIGGDGMECIVDYRDETVMYGALYYGAIRRSTNGGNSFQTIAGNGVNGITESGPWVTPYKLHPTDPDTMFAGFRQIWRTFNVRSAASNAVTWNAISSFPGTSTIRDLAIAPSNPDVVFVARNGSNKFYRSANANAASPTWTNLTANLPVNSTPKDIEIDPNNPNKLWVAINNDVYQSTNGGASWSNFSGTLPNISVNTIVYDHAAPTEALYLGNDAGVFYRDASMADWTNFSTGLPATEITELEIYYDSECPGNDILRAATYGRGLWESDLRDPGNLPPIACFSGSPRETCVGATVLLEDLSAYGPTSWSWTISPATFNYANSTSASSQNPEVQFNAVGTYTITLTSNNANGSDNVTRTSYINISGSALGLPVTEDFETMGLCATTSNCGATACALGNGWENPVNGVEDDIDFRIDEGGTPSTGTGPSIDANPGTATGNYAYLEASSCSGRIGYILSPCIDLRTAVNPEITFAYHMLGNSMGDLHLDVLVNGSYTLDIMPVLSGDQGASWQTRTASLLAFTGSVIKLRFRGETGGGFASDIALDDLIIQESTALPSDMLELTGTHLEGKGNLLEWNLDPNFSGMEFQLEKQRRDGGFEVIGTLDRHSDLNYNLLDRNPYEGINLYRLMSTDIDGKTSLAGVAEVFSAFGNTRLFLFPNPANALVTVEIHSREAATGRLQVFDLMGKELLSQQIETEAGTMRHQLPLDRLKNGIYLVRYRGETVRLVVRR